MSLNSPVETQTETNKEPLSAEPALNVESVVAQLVEGMPEVSQHAIDAHSVAEKANENRDKSGAVFDPSIHATGPDGTPLKTKSGEYARKRGRKAGQSTVGSVSQTSGKVNGQSTGGVQTQAGGNVTVDARALGTIAAAMTINLCIAAGGDDFTPVVDAKNGINEPEFLTRAYGDYFRATGRNDFPPALALAIAVGTYAAPRFTKPTVRTRMFAGFEKLQSAWGKFKAWRKRKSAPVSEPA